MATIVLKSEKRNASPTSGPIHQEVHPVTASRLSTMEGQLRDFNSIINDWPGQSVIVKYHLLTDSWIFIAIHDMTLGPAVGGCRMCTYGVPVDGLRDAMRLAEGMTNKWAILNAARGGAKAVVAMPTGLTGSNRMSLLRCLGETIEDLHGTFQTAGDLGTTVSDLRTLSGFTKYLQCFNRVTGDYIDSGIYTALGVDAGIRSSLKRVFGDETVSGRRIVIQGAGQVGGRLARILTDGGARVLVSDTNRESLEGLQDEIGCGVLSENTALETFCDVLSPCAIGGTMNPTSVVNLNCRIIAGGANNQLQDPEVADQIHQRGILYAPDFVINAGGAIALPMFYEGAGEAEVRAEVCAIGNTLTKLFDEAAALGESPYHAARRSAELVLKKARLALAPDSDQLRVTHRWRMGLGRGGRLF
jgi:glutamate dehydrogenase/leucine dehydrogenase